MDSLRRERDKRAASPGRQLYHVNFFFFGQRLSSVSERGSGCRQGETGSRKGGEVKGGSAKVTQAGSEMNKLERGE